MSILRRLKALFLSETNRWTDEFENPRVSLNYSLMKLEEGHRKVQHSLVEVSAARARLAQQHRQLSQAEHKHHEQAQVAATLGREDLARQAIERKLAVQTRLLELNSHIQTLDGQLEQLKHSKLDLERRMDVFRSKKEELGAVYDASKAQVQWKETVAGISNDLADLGNSIQRTEARILEMRSRADAIDHLLAEGVLSDVLEPGRDSVDRELLRIHRSQQVDEELARLKQLQDSGQPAQKLISMEDQQ